MIVLIAYEMTQEHYDYFWSRDMHGEDILQAIVDGYGGGNSDWKKVIFLQNEQELDNVMDFVTKGAK